MIQKGDWSKIFIIFILSFLFLLCLNSVFAQESDLEPPDSNLGKRILDKTASSSKSLLGKVGETLKSWISSIIPYLENLNSKISDWWINKAKPWFINFYNSIVFYLNKEIIIN
jgi:hypothetical protein